MADYNKLKLKESRKMEDVKVYIVVNLEITDVDTYRKYEKDFFGFLKKYEGEFITYADSF